MRNLTVALIAFLAVFPASAAAGVFGWSISASSVDPCVNTGVASNWVTYLYLWYTYDTGTAGLAHGAGNFVAGGSLQLLAFTTRSPFLTHGPIDYVLLAATGCPTGPVVAGDLLVLDLPGSVCFEFFDGPYACGRDLCAAAITGYSSEGEPCVIDGGIPGADGCSVPPVSVAPDSWGSVKSLYR